MLMGLPFGQSTTRVIGDRGYIW